MTKLQKAYQQTVESWRFKAEMKNTKGVDCGFCDYARERRDRYNGMRDTCQYCPVYKALGVTCDDHPSYIRWRLASLIEAPARARNVLRVLRRLGKKEGWT